MSGYARIRVATGSSVGLATAVVRDQLEVPYLLSCGHVVTDDGRRTRIGQRIFDDDTNTFVGRLFRYVALETGSENPCDVGLVRLESEPLAQTLTQRVPVHSLAPAGLARDQSLSMVSRRGTTLNGHVELVPSPPRRVTGWGDSAVTLIDLAQVDLGGERGDSGAMIRDQHDRAIAVFTAAHETEGWQLATPIRRLLRWAGDPAKNQRDVETDGRVLELRLQPGA